MLDAIQAAVASGDAPSLKRAAHTLKGAVGYFTHGPVYEAALRLESAGRDGHVADVCDVMERLAANLRDVQQELLARRPSGAAVEGSPA
jgi:hypothetical protein